MASLPLSSPVGIRVETIIAYHYLSLIGDMGSDAGDEVQVVDLDALRVLFPILVYYL